MVHVIPRHTEHGARVRPVRPGDDGLTKMERLHQARDPMQKTSPSTFMGGPYWGPNAEHEYFHIRGRTLLAACNAVYAGIKMRIILSVSLQELKWESPCRN
jgi:hypothetical protein